MKIVIKGWNVAPLIEQMTSEDEVMEFFEKHRDKYPLGEESNEQFEQRNARLSHALLSVFYGEDADLEEDGDVVIPTTVNYS